MFHTLICAGLVALWALPAILASPTDDFIKLRDEYFDWRLKENPDYGIDAGRMEFADKNRELTVDNMDQRYKYATKALNDLQKISVNDLNDANTMSYRVLKSQLETFTAGFEYKTFTYNPISFLEGPHIGYSNLVKKLPFKTKKDYDNFLKRLSGFAELVKQVKKLLEEGVKEGKQMHNVSVWRVPSQIKSGILNKAYNATEYYVPFSTTLEGITGISAKEKVDLRKEAKDIIEQKIMHSFQELHDYLLNDYKTRSGLGVSTMATGKTPSGLDFYKAALKWHLSVDISPEEVHEEGLRQVERIERDMKQIAVDVGFKGTLKEFIASLKANQSFFLKTEDELLQRYRDIIQNRINGKLHLLFLNLPKLRLVLIKNPRGAGPGAYYMYQLNNTLDVYEGLLVVNLNNPTKRPTFDMLALCLHEANPGHHMQISYMLTDKTIPDFRKFADYTGYYKTPYHFPFYTAYTEGWALYAEYLGTELGLYTDKYELFGRYVSEMFRACRLVVDTGIHVKGWSREKAIKYMADHITDPISQISVEIDRYVTWPGQACGYKIGEIKILELRKHAEKKLGKLFDVKLFHERILTSAALPIDLLGEVIEDYIKETLVSAA